MKDLLSIAAATLLFTASHAAHAEESGGPLLRLDLGVAVPTGRAFDAADASMYEAFGPGVPVTALIGYYFTPHLGLLGGVQASVLHVKGCPSNLDGCDGTTSQVPVIFEYALTDRSRGFYALAGLGLFTHYTLSGGGMRYTLINDVLEAKVGAGYRHPILDTRSPIALDFNATVDAGQFRQVDLTMPGRTPVEGVTIPERDWHATFLLNAGLVWSL
jgi:hypothetical protein